MQNISITQKMMLVLGLLGLFVIGIAFYVSGQMRHIDRNYTALIEGDSQAALLTAHSNRALAFARGSIGDLVIADTAAEDATAYAGFKRDVASFKTLIDQAAAASPTYAPMIRSLKAQALTVMTQVCARAISMGNVATTMAEAFASQQEYLAHCQPAFPTLSTTFTNAVDTVIANTVRARLALSATTSRTIIITYAGIITGLILIGLIAFGGIRSWIITPLRQQLGIMARLAAGDYAGAVTGSDRRDEVGAIARAVSVFRTNGQEKLRLEAETAAQQARGEEERVRQEADRAAATQQGATSKAISGRRSNAPALLDAGDEWAAF